MTSLSYYLSQVLVVMATLMTPSHVMTSLPLTFDPQQQPCDVTVRDSPGMSWSGGERVVHSVVIELASTGGGAICREGTVTWRYPHHSALRVSFTLPLRSLVSNDRYHYHEDVEGHDVYYKVCCIVSVAYCDVKVSLENAGGAAKRVIGVLNSTSSSTDLVCFQTSASRYHGGGPIALYAQSLPDSSAGLSHVVGRLTIDYDVRPVTSSSHVTECRPCTDTELLEAACMSDFTVEGRMLNIIDSSCSSSKDNVHWTIINIALTNIIRQTTQFADFLKSTAPPHDPSAGLHAVGSGSSDVLTILSLRRPSECRVRQGDGEFVFVGRVRLKRTLSVQCAPRRDEFLRAWRLAVETDLQPCDLPLT